MNGNIQTPVEYLLLKPHKPAAVMIDSDGDIPCMHGRTGSFLEAADGRANGNILTFCAAPLPVRDEMQTSREELKDAREELQSTNAQLTTLKDEMQSLNQKLYSVNAELQSLSDIANDLDYPHVEEDAREVLPGLVFCERRISSRGGRWYMASILPYRTVNDVIDGLVPSFANVTEPARLEAHLAREGGVSK